MSKSRATPSTTLSTRDRAYMNDFVQFGFMNHVIAAEAFRRVYEEADATAVAMRVRVERIDPMEAKREAERLNDAARVQTIAVARLVSEYAAAIEDLAGMIFAIAARDAGLMRSYLTSEPSETGNVLASIDGGKDLRTVLRLPDPAKLPADVDAELRADIDHAFGSFADSIRQIAAAARDAGNRESVEPGDAAADDDRLVLVLDIGEPKRTPPRGILFQAHNRIKHRFMVIERLGALGTLPEEPIRFAHAPRDPVFVRAQVSNITQVALATAELAALVLQWDAISRGAAESPGPGAAT